MILLTNCNLISGATPMLFQNGSVTSQTKVTTFLLNLTLKFYPSITENILHQTLKFEKQYTNIDKNDLRIINHCFNSLLFFDTKTWKKESTDSCFYVTMGSFDGAEVCELVGLYIQSKLEKILPKSNFGLYPDDGLVLSKNLNEQKADEVRKNIIGVFKDVGFNLEIETNLKEVDFLDVALNLRNGTYRPYKKANDWFLYIHSLLSHTPKFIKQIPNSIHKKLSEKFV